MSKNYIKVNSLSVSEELLNFVNREAIEGTNLNKKKFWDDFEKAIYKLVPINKSLLQKRRILQLEIDRWHLNNKEKYQWENVYSPPNKNNEYYRGLGVIQMVQDISKNNVNKEDLYLPFHVLEVMSAIDTYDQNGKWVKIKQQF